MNSGDLFSQSLETLDWAEEAIKEYQSEAYSYFGSKVGRFVEEVDIAKSQKIYKFVLDTPPNTTMRRRATEALLSIRNSYDQSVHAACLSFGHKGGTNYPWRTTPADLERWFKSKSFPVYLRDCIRTHEPYFAGNGYAGGNNEIRELAKLANLKHNVGLSAVVAVSAIAFGEFTDSGPNAEFSIPVPRWNPIKNEIIYARGSLASQSNGQESIKIHIIFDSTQYLKTWGVVYCLELFLSKAKSVHNDLKSICLQSR